MKTIPVFSSPHYRKFVIIHCFFPTLIYCCYFIDFYAKFISLQKLNVLTFTEFNDKIQLVKYNYKFGVVSVSSSRKTNKTTVKNAFVAVAILLVVLFAVALRSFMLKPYDRSKLVYTQPTTELAPQQSTEAETTEVATTNKNGFYIVTKEAKSTQASGKSLSELVLDGYWYYLSTTKGDQFYRYAFTKNGTVLRDLFEKDYHKFEQERKYVIIEREKLTYSVSGNTVSIIDGDETINYTFDHSTGKLTRTFSANGIKYVEDVYRHADYNKYIDEHWVMNN